MARFLQRLLGDDRGFSAAEFALVLPILLILSVGTVEYSRLILLTQKLQSGAFILADLTARDKTLSTEQLGNIFLALDQVIAPFAFETSGRAIVTSIGVDASDDPVVNWQCVGTGDLSATSELGTSGGEATLPADLTISAGETIIASEVYFAYAPLTGIGLQPRVIRRTAFFKPRLGDLATLTCPA
jgi:Flp pilus assembly protein TadG